MTNEQQNLYFDEFVSAHKRQATRKIAKELLSSLCAYGFRTEELLYALAYIFKERGELDKAADYLEKAGEFIPVDFRWATKENTEKQ